MRSASSAVKSRDEEFASALAVVGAALGEAAVGMALAEVVAEVVSEVWLGFAAGKELIVAGSNLPLAEVGHTSSFFAYRKMDTEPEVAAGRVLGLVEDHNYPIEAHCQYSNSPSLLQSVDQVRMEDWDTYPIAGAFHTGVSTHSPSSPPTYGRNISQQSRACCAGQATCRACSSSHRTFSLVSAAASQCSRIVPESVVPSRSYQVVDSAGGRLALKTN